MPTILYSKGLVFTPSEIDISIRPGWFWHEKEEPHSLERLFHTYLTSVGANACLHLNIPPNKDGLLDNRDVKRLKELGELIQKEFGKEIPSVIEKQENEPATQPVYTIVLEKLMPLKRLKYVILREDIARGQRVESFRVSAVFTSGGQYPLYQGTCIGNKKICQLQNPFALQNPLIDDSDEYISKLKVQVTAARDEVVMKEIKVY